jgi:hypothetical protein
MERSDWTLLAVCFSGPKGLSPVQLQKSLFLLGAELQREVGHDFYTFIPHNYGPFSKQIYTDAEQLAANGLIAIEREPGSPAQYVITALGRNRALEVERELSQRVQDYFANVVTWTQQRSFSSLIRSIYEKYPEYRVNSVFQY